MKSDAEALVVEGNSLREAGADAEALAFYDRALVYDPDSIAILNFRGLTLAAIGRIDEALESLEDALTIDPLSVETLNNLGTLLLDQKRYPEALKRFDDAIAIRPQFAQALHNRSVTLRELRRRDEALVSADEALRILPEFTNALKNRADILQELMRCEEALVAYERAISIDSKLADAQWNDGLCRLLMGDFANGWEKYEWRWKVTRPTTPIRSFSQPLWLGRESISGKTILLHAEQGLGDSIQFVRYVPAVAALGAKVILQVQSSLKTLLSDCIGAQLVLDEHDPLPETDLQCPLMSLPLAFDTKLDTIPASVPYLQPSEMALRHWREMLGSNDSLKIGIAWSGNSTHRYDQDRSMRLRNFSALSGLDITLVSLQNDVRTEDENFLKSNPDILHFGSAIRDFSDTAAIVAQMDLVVSVDTAVAHLAGAMARPVWLMLPFFPDWRWMREREDSPWYPTARLFRQTRSGEWDDVIDKVKQALIQFVEFRRNQGT